MALGHLSIAQVDGIGLALDLTRLQLQHWQEIHTSGFMPLACYSNGFGVMMHCVFRMRKEFSHQPFVRQRDLNLIKCSQGHCSKICHGLLVVRGRNLDLRPQRSALVDRHEHPKNAVNEPRVEAQYREQEIALTPTFQSEREVRKQCQFRGLLGSERRQYSCSAATISGRLSSSEEGSPGAIEGGGGANFSATSSSAAG
jgi:hypothetical protein